MIAARIGLFGVLALAGCATVKPADPASLRDLTLQERAILAPQLAQGLKDPASAQFRWAKIGAPDEKGHARYCGQINAKNSYGGYVGFAPFAAIVTFRGAVAVGAAMLAIGDDTGGALAVEQNCHAWGLDPDSAS